MNEIETQLTNEELEALMEISHLMQSVSVLSALEKLRRSHATKQEINALRAKAFGMWKDRTDLPDFDALRHEWDRFPASQDIKNV